MKKSRQEKYMYYGFAILICVLIVSGLLSALRGTDKKGKKENTEKAKEETISETPVDNPNIRVVLMTDGYQNLVHPSIEVSSPSGLMITYGDAGEECTGDQTFTAAPDDERFQKGNIRLQAKDGGKITVNSLRRSYGPPEYAGILELRTTAEGIALINELPVEDYLCCVVPSEMPASYELEALKVQAVCARSYAYRQMQEYAYPEYEAHINDSTDFQVYGNSREQESSTRAVNETSGQVVRYKGEVVTTYYYSTSCGKTTSIEAWGTAVNEQNDYLKSVEIKGDEGDYEKDLPWYRWEAVIPVQTMSNLVGLNTGTDIGSVNDIAVTKTGPGGVVLQIQATGEKGSVTVDTENKIRKALGGSGYEIKKQDGNTVSSQALLPSAFFTIEKTDEHFVIKGGGYGHGIGMSQNGANEMAKQGKNYKEILALFYQGTTVE